MISRRVFLATATAAAAVLALPAHASQGSDPIDRLIALSTDARGLAHIDAVAFVGPDGEPVASDHIAALPITRDEARALHDAFRRRDHQRFRVRGPRVAGRKFVFLSESEGLLLATGGGYGLCVQDTPAGLVIVRSAPGMIQGCANVALWKYTRAT